MNVRGRDVLIGAAIDGIGQLRGQPADGRGRFSATGLLFDRVGCPHLLMAPDKSALPEQQAAHERCKRKVKRRFGFSQTDLMTVDRLNDSLGADFLSIAWILSGGVDLSTKPPVSDTVSLTSDLRHVEPSASALAPSNNKLAEHIADAAVASDLTPGSSLRCRGYLKSCRSCGYRIYLHHDLDGVWRPYESWAGGRVVGHEWRRHVCY